MAEGGLWWSAFPVLRWLGEKFAAEFGKTTATVAIHVPIELVVPEIKFGLCHVRDGKEQTAGEVTPIKNKALPFRRVDDRGHFQCNVRHRKRLGFQFKCFVDYSVMPREKGIALLTDHGFQYISLGAGKPNRLWFILPEYAIHKTTDNPPLLNNFFYPE